MKIGYFADGPWAHQALEGLLNDRSLDIAFICARYDNPDLFLKSKASNYGIDFIVNKNINSQEFIDSICSYECDMYVSMSFNQIFREKIIELTPNGIINCHAGLLPFYRGRNILNWVLINDEKEFGVTVHYVDSGIDTGDIIVQSKHSISDEDNYETLLNRAYSACAKNLIEAIKKIQDGDINLIPQNSIHPTGMYCVGRQKDDEILNWCQTSREIFNFVRAICRPGPQARTFFNEVEIKINRVQLIPGALVYKGIPGAVVGIEVDGFLVKTLDSYIKIIEWIGYQKPRIGDRFL